MMQRKKSRKIERTQAISTTKEIEEIKVMIQNLNNYVLDMKNRAYSTNENSDKEKPPQYSSPRFENYKGNHRGRSSFIDKDSCRGDNLHEMLHVTNADNRDILNIDAGCI